MKLGLRRNDIRQLATDELAVVLYLRLLFINLPFAGIVAIAMMELANITLGEDALKDRRSMFLLAVTLTLYFAWTFRVFFVIRQELRQREHRDLTHTPTFYSWARATHVLAIVSLMRPLFGHWLSSQPFETAAGLAWVLSALMAGFYLVYFVLLLLVWQRPPGSILWAFLLALAAASFPPHHVAH